jgi:hypothetical protein
MGQIDEVAKQKHIELLIAYIDVQKLAGIDKKGLRALVDLASGSCHLAP